jgi:hypothetical protein
MYRCSKMKSTRGDMSYWKFSTKLFGPMYDMWMDVARCWNESSSGKTYVLAEKPFTRPLSNTNSISTALNVNRVSLLGSRRLFAWAPVLPYLSSHPLPLQRRHCDKIVYRHKTGKVKTPLQTFLMKIKTSVLQSSPISVLDLFILKNLPILKQQMISPHNYILFCVH